MNVAKFSRTAFLKNICKQLVLKQKGSHTILNTLIQANTLIIKVLTRIFIMLNTMMENESKSFTDISIFSPRSQSQIIVFIFVFRNFLALLLQVKAGQNYD